MMDKKEMEMRDYFFLKKNKGLYFNYTLFQGLIISSKSKLLNTLKLIIE